MPLDERPAAAGRENSWAERLFYLAVAGVWAYCISTSLEPLGAGGSHSRRDLGAFLLPLLTISAFLVGCAATSRGSRVGRLARWLAIAGIFLGIAGLVPLFAMFAFWLVAAVFGAASGATPYLFFGGLLSLVSALPVLFRAVAAVSNRNRALTPIGSDRRADN